MAATTRSQKLKRLVAVQRHLERMAEHELAATTQQRDEVSRSMDQVIDAIGSMDPVHRLFSQHYSERFGKLASLDVHLSGVQKVHERQVMKERAKAERLEEGMKEARMLEDRELDDNAIYDLLEQQLAMPAGRRNK